VVIDLDIVEEPMIADPDVNNADVSKRYTHDNDHCHFMVELKRLI
jgi:aconitase B